MEISAEITGIKYKPYLCKELKKYKISEFYRALTEDGAFSSGINQESLQEAASAG